MLSEKPKSGLSETRKMTKSTMEKKRRARINDSLTELKSILAGMVTHKGERFDKMEKADILELTVKCVRQLQKQANNVSGRPSTLADDNYRSGMHTCMSEVIKFISSNNFSDANPEVKTKLLDHLANKLSSGSDGVGVCKQSPINYPNISLNETSMDSSVDDERSRCPSTFSNDSNNNSQAIDNRNSFTPTYVQVQTQQPQTSPLTSPLTSPVFASFKPIQSVMDTSSIQSHSNVPSVPLTILVPANFCQSSLGTTCVIPVNLQSAHPQVNQAAFMTGQTFTPHPFTSVAFTNGSGISVVASQSISQSINPSSSNSVLDTMSNTSSFIAFTPSLTNNVCEISRNMSDSAFTKAATETVVGQTCYTQQTNSSNQEYSNNDLKSKVEREEKQYKFTNVIRPVPSVNETVSSNTLKHSNDIRNITFPTPTAPVHVLAYESERASQYANDSLKGNLNLLGGRLNRSETESTIHYTSQNSRGHIYFPPNSSNLIEQKQSDNRCYDDDSESRARENILDRNIVNVPNVGESSRNMWRPW